MARSEPEVTFTLDAETYFVLTESLREFSARQTDLAEHDLPSAQSRMQWSEIADEAVKKIEGAAS